MDQLRLEEEVLEDLEERFSSRSELVFEKERMNELQDIVGVCGGNGYKKEDLEKKKREKKQIEFKLTQSAIKNVTKQFSAKGVKGYDALSFIQSAKNNIIQILNSNKRSKIYIVLSFEMERTDLKTGETITTISSFSTKAEVVIQSTNLNELYERAKNKILELLSTFQQLGSSKSYIPHPKELAAKKAIINIKNEDNECFKWCVARFFNLKDDHPERVDKDLKEQAKKLNCEKIEFPVSLDQITLFQKNYKDISVNVLGYKSSVYPLHISENKNIQHQIDLLIILNDETNHYCLIKSLSRLLSSQISKHDGKMHFCRNCLLGFSTEESLSKHKLYCDTHDSVRIKLSEPNTMIEFNHFKKSMRVPFVVYADFESFIKPINTCTPNPNKSYTKQYQRHTPSSFSYYIKCFDESEYKSKPIIFAAKSEKDDVAQKFVDMLQADIKKIYNNYLRFLKKMKFTTEDKNNFNNAEKCHICEEELKEDRVRNHCQITGKYRGAAHKDYNLQFKIPKFIPFFFYNITGYDSHLFIKKLLKGGKINRIPNNEEKYISFSKEIQLGEFINTEGKNVEVKKELLFVDSFKFMSDSLDGLVKNLTKEQCNNIRKFYSENKLNLLQRKESFYSRLNNEDISDEDYLHAQTVWKEFNCENFRDYHNLYNVSNVLLLADVFENFTDLCIKNYKLDPAWYYTAPGLAWGAALKQKQNENEKETKLQLKLLSDYDMILMIKQGIRSGVSMISNRLGTANNKYMETYDKSKESTYIMYLDANNLYGWAMSKVLPTHGFQWMNEGKLKNWKSILCILEVNLDYPEHLHDLHNDYPLAPERLKND
ncbi:uncharacterized protein LOC136072408 [Hydra vulgaris]|uniref:uncharacterized protein LOC136072408 n=1 Tax=Hydra vulgaris TaxID=6087 RepID=UPI0032EA6E9D